MCKTTMPLVAGPLLFVLKTLISTDLVFALDLLSFRQKALKSILYSDIAVCVNRGVPVTAAIPIFCMLIQQTDKKNMI